MQGVRATLILAHKMEFVGIHDLIDEILVSTTLLGRIVAGI